MKKKNCNSHFNRKTMFSGKSCAPLSPSKVKKRVKKISTRNVLNNEESKETKKVT